MLQWLTRRRVMGGLVFGAPAWMPPRIENTFEERPGESGSEGGQVAGGVGAPSDRAGLVQLLERLGLGRTSGVIPSLVEQARDVCARKDAASLRALILCLLPTQPEFTLGAALSRLAPDDMQAGLRAVQKALAARRLLVVVDRHDHVSARAWRRMLDGCGGRVVRLLNRYPQAHPTVLLRRLFGSRLPVQALPTTVGCVVMDAVSCWAVGRYLRTGRALRDRPVQIFLQNSREHAAHLVMARIGETVSELGVRYGITTPAASAPSPGDQAAMQVIINGVMSGQAVDATAARVDSATEAVAVRERPAVESPVACLECGWCVDVCPTGLTPVRLMELVQRVGEGAKTAALPREAAESQHCIGCGLCSYVCPSRLPLASETLRLRGILAGRPQHDRFPVKPEGGR